MKKAFRQKNEGSIQSFIAGYPAAVQTIMNKLLETIHRAAPGAEETISYGIPTLKYHGNLVHFSAYKSHIGFYPGASGIEVFKNELSGFQLSKGTVRFPIDKPLPWKLITKIVKFRVRENRLKAELKNDKNLRVCPEGHKYKKSSNCNTCPVCERERKPAADFMTNLAAPARRALKSAGIKTLRELSGYNISEISALHGVGNSAIVLLKQALRSNKLKFKGD